MSHLTALLRRVFAWLNTPAAAPQMEPKLEARDWADLPPHHPKTEGAPC